MRTNYRIPGLRIGKYVTIAVEPANTNQLHKARAWCLLFLPPRREVEREVAERERIPKPDEHERN